MNPTRYRVRRAVGSSFGFLAIALFLATFLLAPSAWAFLALAGTFVSGWATVRVLPTDDERNQS